MSAIDWATLDTKCMNYGRDVRDIADRFDEEDAYCMDGVCATSSEVVGMIVFGGGGVSPWDVSCFVLDAGPILRRMLKRGEAVMRDDGLIYPATGKRRKRRSA